MLLISYTNPVCFYLVCFSHWVFSSIILIYHFLREFLTSIFIKHLDLALPSSIFIKHFHQPILFSILIEHLNQKNLSNKNIFSSSIFIFFFLEGGRANPTFFLNPIRADVWGLRGGLGGVESTPLMYFLNGPP